MLIIIVGIYGGVCTVNEAASLGALLAFLFAIVRRKLTWASYWNTLADTAASTGMIYTIIIGANVFNYFIVLSHVPDVMTKAIVNSGWPIPAIFVAMLIVYLILGSIFDTISAMVITLPFVLPLILNMGYSPIWWGISQPRDRRNRTGNPAYWDECVCAARGCRGFILFQQFSGG